MGDKGITTAILDRLLHKVEVIHLNGENYRIKIGEQFLKQKVFKLNEQKLFITT